jgi:hypothetical protein
VRPEGLGKFKISPHWVSNSQNQKIMFLESRERPMRRDDNLAAICEPIVYTMWDP